jgi:hypothetical protein
MVQGIAVNFISDAERALLKTKQFKDIKAAILTLARDASGPFGPKPLDRNRILTPLFQSLGLATASVCCEVKAGYPAVIAPPEALVPGQVDRSNKLNLFRSYCGSCHTHSQGKEQRLDFFPVADAAAPATAIPDEWLQFLFKGSLPCKRLNWEKLDPALLTVAGESPMPPPVSASTFDTLKAAPKDRVELLENYRAMAAAVAADSGALDRMANLEPYSGHRSAAVLRKMLQDNIVNHDLCKLDPAIGR